jgi:hypothetical protein
VNICRASRCTLCRIARERTTIGGSRIAADTCAIAEVRQCQNISATLLDIAQCCDVPEIASAYAITLAVGSTGTGSLL